MRAFLLASTTDPRRRCDPWMDREYWLRRCQGFVVLCGEDVVGTVEDVLYGARHDAPDALLIRTPGLRGALTRVDVDTVEGVAPDHEELELAACPRSHPTLVDRLTVAFRHRERPVG